MRTRRPQRAAITLIELMIVIVLLGIAAMLVTVRMSGATETAQLRGAALAIETELRTARHWSLQHRQPSRLQFDLQTNRYRWLRAGETDDTGRWHELSGMRLEVSTPTTQVEPRDDDHVLTIRVNARGFCAPWSIDLVSEQRRQRLHYAGVGELLQVSEVKTAGTERYTV